MRRVIQVLPHPVRVREFQSLLYRICDIDAIVSRLRLDESPAYANDFKRRLLLLYQRYETLDHTARQIRGGEPDTCAIVRVLQKAWEIHPPIQTVETKLRDEHAKLRAAIVEEANEVARMVMMLGEKWEVDVMELAAEAQAHPTPTPKQPRAKRKGGKKPSDEITHFLNAVASEQQKTGCDDDAAVKAYRTTHTVRANKLARNARELKRKLQKWRSSRKDNGKGK